MKLTDPVFGQPKVRVEYVAFDSLGVKSMCTRVTTPDVCITIDPGASAESASFPLPEPRRIELARRYESACRLSSSSSQAIVISHYHLDHFVPQRAPDVYGRKVVFVQSHDKLPPRQQARAKRFFRSIDGLPEETVRAEGRRFRFKKTEVSFSKPVWHGETEAEPGTVMMTTVRRGRERVLVSSDVAGPVDRNTAEQVCAAQAQTVVLDGYPTTLLGPSGADHKLVQSIVNVCRILAQPELRTLVIDHHLARDYRYPALLKIAYDKARELGRQFGTAAELVGRASAVLDGLKDYGPTKWRRWSPLGPAAARKVLEAAVSARETTEDWLADFDRWVG